MMKTVRTDCRFASKLRSGASRLALASAGVASCLIFSPIVYGTPLTISSNNEFYADLVSPDISVAIEPSIETNIYDTATLSGGSIGILAGPSDGVYNPSVESTIGTLSISSGGAVLGGAYAIAIMPGSSAATISNAGSIAGTNADGVGIWVSQGSIDLINNYHYILGGSLGIGIGVSGSGGSIQTISNSGTIRGGSIGIDVENGGSIVWIDNDGILGGSIGIGVGVVGTPTLASKIASITDDGSIISSFAGIAIGDGQVSLVAISGLVSGNSYGITIGSNGTLSDLVIQHGGTVKGATDAIASAGIFKDLTNKGIIAGNITVSGALTITGAAGNVFDDPSDWETMHDDVGTLTGYVSGTQGTIAAASVVINGAQYLDDNLVLGSGALTNNGALIITHQLTLTGNFTQASSGELYVVNDSALGGGLSVSGNAAVDGSIHASLSRDENYIVGDAWTLVSCGGVLSGDYTVSTIAPTGLTVTRTVVGNDLLLAYDNDYIGVAQGAVDNTGTIRGVATGVYVASSGNLGTLTNEGWIAGTVIGVDIKTVVSGTSTHSGTIGMLTNSGTISGASYAIYNAGVLGTLINSGLISGNIYSAGTLSIAGGAGTVGMFSGGTITAAGVQFTDGTLALADAVSVGSGTVVNAGAVIGLSSVVSIIGTYTQSIGALSLGTSGELTVTGSASITGGTVAASLASTGNYLAGTSRTLVASGAGSSYAGITFDISTLTGLSDTVASSGGDLVVTYANDYIGGSLSSISNTGNLTGLATAVYVATTGTLGTLTNSGTISGTYDVYDAGSIGTLINSGHIGSDYGVYVASTGTLASIVNTGTLTGDVDAIDNAGVLGTIMNSGLIAGNIVSVNDLTILSNTRGTLSGGTIAANVDFVSGTLALADAIVGSATLSGATLEVASTVSISGAYSQSSGALSLGTSGELSVTGSASITGGTVAVSLASTGNYLAGTSRTLVAAADGSSYAGATLDINAVTGLIETTKAANGDLLIAYANDYVGGSLNSISNTGNLTGVATAVYVAAGGTLGTLTNSGTIGGTSYAIYNKGVLGTIVNSGLIAGNVYSTSTLSIAGGTTAAGTLSGGTIAADVDFVSGTLALSDAVDGNATLSGATLEVATTTIVGNYTQTAGVLDLSGTLTVTGSASITGGTIVVATSDNYYAGATQTLIDAGSASDYRGVTVDLAGGNGLLISVDTVNASDLTVSYLDDYVGGSLTNLSNTGSIGGAATAVYVAATGSVGTLTNNGTLSGSLEVMAVLGSVNAFTNDGLIVSSGATYGIRDAGSIGTLTNAGTITGNHYDVYVSGLLGTLINAGHIGSDYGVYVASGGSLASIVNTGTLTGDVAALYNAGSLGTIVNTGLISGNIYSDTALLFAGGSGSSGTLSGGTIAASAVTFSGGTVALADAVVGNVATTGATLELTSSVSITGNYTQTGGTLVSTVTSATSYGALTVSGSAAIANATIALSGSTVTVGQTYTIVDAGATSSYSGDTVTVVGSHYRVALSTSGDDLLATVRYAFKSVGSTIGGDAATMGSVLDALSDAGKASGSLDKLSALSDADLGTALQQAAPAQVSGGAALLTRGTLFDTEIGSAIASRASETNSGWSLWAAALGGAAHRGAVSGAESYDTTAVGLIAGADALVSEGLRVGGAVSWNEGWNGGAGAVAGNANGANSYQLTGYAAWTLGALSVSGRIGAGVDTYASRREMTALDLTARGHATGYHVGTALEAGYGFSLSEAATVTPTASLTWLHLNGGSLQEHGAGEDDLHLAGFDGDSVESGLGTRLSWAFETPLGRLFPQVQLSWVHAFINAATRTDASLDGYSFATTVRRVAPDGAKLSAGLELLRAGDISVRASYDGEFRSRYTAHTGQLQIAIAF